MPSEHDEVKQAAGGGQETKTEGQNHEEDHDVEIHGEQLKIDVAVGTEVTDRTDKPCVLRVFILGTTVN